MSDEPQKSPLDPHLRLRLAELSPEIFERFFLHFLNAGISLAIERDGERLERRIIEASTYAAGTGRSQDGVDLVAKVEGGETWAFQCKRHKTWNVSKTEEAIAKAAGFPAQHYFLLVACDPHEEVQKFIASQPKWSFWNLDRICEEFRLRVPQSKQAQALYFLTPEELKCFAPYSTDALVPATDYFAGIQRAGHSFHHRYKLVGRSREQADMAAFVQSTTSKVLLISGKGGEGKSRLLWELANTVGKTSAAPEVLFLNPHSSGDVALAMWDKDTPRVVVVDDAHRLERVSHELLSCIRESKEAKLVLATRPQGNEALIERLREHGLQPVVQPLEVHPLKKVDMHRLAEEALGTDLKGLAKDLVALTGDSPFLTALAGDLLRRDQLKWGQWHSDEEFRSAVFRSFEQDNLAHLPPLDRQQGAQLLRIIALLAPVTPDAVFHERAAACLGLPAVQVEALLRRMQAAGVVSAETRNVRVIPDLFADSLVFDTAFDPQHRLPELARMVLQQFAQEAAALLRNLAEATWLARTKAIGRDELLRPLLDAEFARFDDSNFFERGRMIEQWATFSVYLPAESLELARKALAQTTAPSGATPEFQLGPDDEGINSHRYVRSWLPSLLKPVVLWHDEHRAATLDFLWQLGCDTPKGMFNGGKNHPWNVIAEVLTFEPRKPIAIVADALDWVARLVRRPSVLKRLEENQSILSTFTEPCFARFVEFREWQGRTLRWWSQPADLERTNPLRERALAILQWVIENGSWLAALDAVRALERALHRIAGVESSHVKQPEKFRELWRPERLKALALLSQVLPRHTQPVMRFSIRQLLHRDLAYEEDAVFAAEVCKVLATIVDDLDLRLANVVNTQGYFEFAEEIGPPKGEEAQEKIKEMWKERIDQIALEYLEAFPQSEAAVAKLEGIILESIVAGLNPRLGELLPAIARLRPEVAIQLAEVLLDPASTVLVAASWHQFLFGFDAGRQDEIWRLIQKAAQHPRSDIRRGVVDYFRFRNPKEMALDERECALLEQMAAKAGPEEILAFVVLVQWVGPSCAEWGYELLRKLRLADLPDELHGEVLAALNPYHARKVDPPLATVRHVLDALIKVPEIKVDHHGGGYERIAKLYPRAIYDFVLQRAARYEKSGQKARYQAVPHDILARFQLEGLSADADFEKICTFLWEKMMAKGLEHMRYVWRELFQGIVLDRVDFWLPKLTAEVNIATSLTKLRELMEVIHFDGSLIVFYYPEFTKAVLQRAEDLDGIEGYERMRTTLWVVSGPRSRSRTNGELDKDKDYVEAGAAKAATAHAADTVLGPFFRWIVEVEQHERDQNRKRYQADMASLDEEEAG